jgi:hypothetical protein
MLAVQGKWRGLLFGAWGFAVAAAFLPGIYSAPFLPRWWVLAIGLAFVPRFDLRLIDERVLWCFGATLLWGALTLMWTPALYGGALLLAFLMLFCLVAIASASATSEQRAFALSGFAAAMLVSAAIAFAQRFFDYHGVPQGVPGLPAGLFFNTEVLAEAAAPIAVWCALQWRDPVYAITAVVLILLLIVAQERVALAVLMIGCAYGLIGSTRWRLAVFALIAIAGFAALFAKISSADQRVLLWSTAAMTILRAGDLPAALTNIMGHGIGWWFQAHPFPQEEYVHSDALQFFVELGVFAVPLCAIPAVAWWGPRTPGDIPARAAFLALVVESVVSFPLHMPATCFLFAVLTGALATRRADVRLPGLSGGIDNDDDPRWQAAQRGILRHDGQRSLGVVSVRSAHPQHADVDLAHGRECRAAGAAIAAST